MVAIIRAGAHFVNLSNVTYIDSAACGGLTVVHFVDATELQLAEEDADDLVSKLDEIVAECDQAWNTTGEDYDDRW